MNIRSSVGLVALSLATPVLAQSVRNIAIGGGGGIQANGRTALAGQVFVGAFQLQGKSLFLGAPGCWLAGGGGGGGDCNGQEVIAKATCAIKNGAPTKTVVLVKNATPHATYTAVLDTGQSVSNTAGDRGKVKFLFKGVNKPPCGPNGVTVCGTRKPFGCGC
ncbi:MAG: hypothetical protein IT449_13270 [Phycisphaerales bacterium]|nr:hypothetical protein [Phycisphaerales bacterium]